MKRKNHHIRSIILCIFMLVLILDSKTSMSGVTKGIDLCIRCVIPALFPMMFVTSSIIAKLSDSSLRLPSFLSKLLRIPKGTDIIFIVSLLAGYPVGARNVTEAYRNNYITKHEANYMLAFCNNAGPAFIFGIGVSIFNKSWIVCILWFIQIITAVITAIVTPSNHEIRNTTISHKQNRSTILDVIKSTAIVCGWVIIFRIILEFIHKWILWLLPSMLQIIITGALELTNGVIAIAQLTNESVKFILFSTMISFGGLCVHMQTASVSEGMNQFHHVIGKINHSLLSTALAVIIQEFIFPKSIPYSISILIVAVCVTILIILQKTVDFSNRLLYNEKKSKRGTSDAVSKENATAMQLLSVCNHT